MNRTDCGKSYLAADKPNSFCMDVTVHKLAMLRSSNLAKKDLRILVGLLTGHADLNRHLHIMGLRQDSGCPLCQEDEDTTLHFIAHCRALILLLENILELLPTLRSVRCELGPCCGLSTGYLLTAGIHLQVR